MLIIIKKEDGINNLIKFIKQNKNIKTNGMTTLIDWRRRYILE